MRSSFRISLTALAASAFAVAAVAGAAAQADNPSGPPWMQHWAADHEAMLNAKLAGLKAGLGLNADQEKLWGPFEAAVRDVAQLRMQHMKARMEHRGGERWGGSRMGGSEMGESEMGRSEMGEEEGAPGSPIDRLAAMADHLSEAGAALKKVADTAKPLYASFDETQKRVFLMLGREMFEHGHGEMGWGHGRHEWRPSHHWGEGPEDEEE
ncbi:MAG TPA: Spy/CpxP family protein refolding chaperone [Roseiarcus sp.]|nr:Spy/CpxP family protein refolding chaperone [Roseiarcus sp.]